jgi:hypothetical protein
MAIIDSPCTCPPSSRTTRSNLSCACGSPRRGFSAGYGWPRAASRRTSRPLRARGTADVELARAAAHRRVGSLLETLGPARHGAYLLTALRVCRDLDASLASSITHDVAALVKQGDVSGRAFLRLAGADLNE